MIGLVSHTGGDVTRAVVGGRKHGGVPCHPHGHSSWSRLAAAGTGKSVEFRGSDIIRVEDGKAAEHWGTTDNMRFMQQIGVIPG